jgi:hypothetical protein
MTANVTMIPSTASTISISTTDAPFCVVFLGFFIGFALKGKELEMRTMERRATDIIYLTR